MKGQIMTIKVFGNHLVAIHEENTNAPRVLTTSSAKSARVFSKEEAAHALEVLTSLGYPAAID